MSLSLPRSSTRPSSPNVLSHVEISSAEVQKDNAGNADDTVSIHVENETPTRGTEAAEKVGDGTVDV